MFMLFLLCFSLMNVAQTTDQTAVVWLVLTNIQLVIFLPLVNVGAPANVNEISMGLAKYFRMDFINYHGQSLTEWVN